MYGQPNSPRGRSLRHPLLSLCASFLARSDPNVTFRPGKHTSIMERLGWKRLRAPVPEGDLVGSRFHPQRHVSHSCCIALTNACALATVHCSSCLPNRGTSPFWYWNYLCTWHRRIRGVEVMLTEATEDFRKAE